MIKKKNVFWSHIFYEIILKRPKTTNILPGVSNSARTLIPLSLAYSITLATSSWEYVWVSGLNAP